MFWLYFCKSAVCTTAPPPYPSLPPPPLPPCACVRAPRLFGSVRQCDLHDARAVHATPASAGAPLLNRGALAGCVALVKRRSGLDDEEEGFPFLALSGFVAVARAAQQAGAKARLAIVFCCCCKCRAQGCPAPAERARTPRAVSQSTKVVAALALNATEGGSCV